MLIREHDPIDEQPLNLTSMTDLVFLLLIFFLCATTFMQRERALELELPEASSAEQRTGPLDEIVINVLRDGRISLLGAIVERGTLENELSRAATRDRATPVTIRGDRLAHHEVIVDVMDACGAVGLTNLAVGTLEGS